MSIMLLNTLIQQQKLVCITATLQFEITQLQDSIQLFDEETLASNDLFTLIPELIGCEDILLDVANELLPNFTLENLNRTNKEIQTIYLNLTVLHHPKKQINDENLLLIILQDTSEFAQIQHTLTQQRNELHLLQHQLTQTNQQLEYILKHYVPRAVGNALLNKQLMPELGGELREISILFADIRNYTCLSEQMTPKQIIDLLHIYLDLASCAVDEAEGVVVNYMGDALMAIFNAPAFQQDHAQQAIQAGLAIQQKVNNFRNQYHATTPVYFGVGVNTGLAVVGNIGGESHYQYTAVGDSVNVASRICSYARANEVLVGENTFTQAGRYQNTLVSLDQPLLFKGKTQRIQVYRAT